MKKFFSTIGKPYINAFDKNSIPFMSQQFVNLAQSFKEPIQLEKMINYKIIKKQQDNDEFETQNQRREFLIVGRSNVGKSSLINSLVEQKQAETSNQPGKTRDLWFYKIANNSGIIMVDAPGYGFAVGNKQELVQWGKMINTYLTQSKYLHRVVCLIDAEHLIKEVDILLMEMLEQKKQPFIIVFTKCDKVKNTQKLFDEAQTKILQKFQFCSPIFHATSSRTNFGIQELRCNLSYILTMPILQKL